MLSNYSKLNNLIGWLVFGVAAFTYVSTVEPTASFWDCGEYIATAVKLQVGHPPGAPFFQLVGNVFSRGAFGNVEDQAYMVNLVSALSSAFTILFLFWTITALGKKFALKYGELTDGRLISIYGSGVVGALAYTFSDSFWFSATEGEVYAMSSLFTAIAFWAIFKWENEVDHNPRASRWLIFIAYMTGLSIGVHILVFLTIPAIAMIYFFKKDKQITTRKFLMYNIIAVIVLGVVFAGIIPLILNSFGKLEIFFVNMIGLPFNSGTIVATLLLVAISAFGLIFTRKKEQPLLNTAILSVLFIVLGYSTFITLAIRSNANTPIDENNPEDALSLLAYYKREQYGDWPVMYGQYFNAPVTGFSDGTPVYKRDDEAGEYVVTDDRKQSVREFDSRYKGFFPRMWSDNSGHIKNYKEIAGIKNDKKKPSFGKNLYFFFNYQLGHMWWRYFMWNFAGRQNDEQHRYEFTKGNWLSGIAPLDEVRLGPQSDLPYHLKNNPARNHYYLLPFLLGLVGLYFHFKHAKKDAWAVLLFFLFTGIAVVIYTNHKPFEPRERDYAFVGSFYGFAIWIGLGVQALFELLNAKMKNKGAAIGVSAAALVLVPVIMAAENWDDHDRSDRYVARDVAKAYLDSCEPNAILFTNGDNDTFPLWYIQEIEGYRTDVRVVNLSLLNTDWYIDQMKRAAYDAAPVPFSFEKEQYQQGTRDVVYHRQDPRIGDARWKVEDLIKWLKRDDSGTFFEVQQSAKKIRYYPVKKVRVDIDKEAAIANGAVNPEDADKIVDYIDWNLNSSILSKRDIMVVDLIANNDWTRPIYFSVTVGNNPKSFFWLQEYFELEGLAYRFVPINHGQAERGTSDYGVVDTDVMYNNLMNKFSYGNMEKEGVYLDETSRRVTYNLRNSFGRLAQQLVKEGENEKAITALDKAMEVMPESKFEFNYFITGVIEGYYQAGATEKGKELVDLFTERLYEQLEYYKTFDRDERKMIEQEIRTAVSYLQLLMQTQQRYTGGQNPNDFQNSEIFQKFSGYIQEFGLR